MTGKTLREVSAEYHEGVHHPHKDHERKRGFFQKRGLGGPSHKEKSQRSTVQYNVLHAGFAKSRICSLESQRRKKLLTSAISNAYKIYNSIQICIPNSWLAKMFVVTLVTLIWPVCCLCVTSNY